MRIPYDKYRVEDGFWLDVTAQHYFMNQDFTPAHGMLGFQMTKTRNKDPRHHATKEWINMMTIIWAQKSAPFFLCEAKWFQFLEDTIDDLKVTCLFVFKINSRIL